jgi:hypothetical protein
MPNILSLESNILEQMADRPPLPTLFLLGYIRAKCKWSLAVLSIYLLRMLFLMVIVL